MRNSRATFSLLLQDEQNPGKFQGRPHCHEFLHRVDKKAKLGRCGNPNLFSQCPGSCGQETQEYKAIFSYIDYMGPGSCGQEAQEYKAVFSYIDYINYPDENKTKTKKKAKP